MATLTAITYNVFQAIGLVRPRIEVVVREPAEYTVHKPIRMQWVRETDAQGRKIMRIRWVEDTHREC
jgi:hypothetical protein